MKLSNIAIAVLVGAGGFIMIPPSSLQACSMKKSALNPGKYYDSCTMEYYEEVPGTSYGSNTRLRPAYSGYSDGYSDGDYQCNGYSCYAQ
tara:strand:- start:310 stop:579 length:270 start_codon:yes stop_codon:yes gene_type:complete